MTGPPTCAVLEMVLQIKLDESRAIFIHCRHALNFATEISKLVKFSPRGDAIFERIKSELASDSPGFRTLCPTKWTVRAASLESVLKNYDVSQQLWEEALEVATDSEVHARIVGVQTTITKFEYLFGVILGDCILNHTDNLSKTLQNPSLTASEGQYIAELTCQTLKKI